MRHLLFFNLGLFAAVAVAFLYLYLLDGLHAPFRCAFAEATHLYCPGCGFTRAARALLSFDLVGAFLSHPASLAAIAALLYYEVAFFLAARGRGRVRAWPAIAFAAVLCAVFVLRNALMILFGVDFLGDFGQEWGILVR